jgi:hypothetical protein
MSMRPAGKHYFLCPFCASRLIKRSSWLVHPLLRSEVYQCDRADCGASFNASAELTHIASTTGLPDAPPSPLPPTPKFLRALAHQAYLARNSRSSLSLEQSL